MDKKLIIEVNEKPEKFKWLLLSFQHVFAMFGATILVPLLTGFSVSVALFASGLGTLTYIYCTKGKVPVYLGSSFAYMSAVILAVESMGGSISASQTGLMLVGIIYVIVAFMIKMIGKNWIDKLLPSIVIGPMIIVIGLSLASSAVRQAGLVLNGDYKHIFVAVITFLIAVMISTRAKGFLKIAPFLAAIFIGYVISCFLGLVDFYGIIEAKWFTVPDFAFPFYTGHFKQYEFYFGAETLAILPVAIVTISEHIGDHKVLGKICDQDFLRDPGLDKTLIGDGIATSISALIGGPANTTYGENTGVIGLTRVGSVYVTGGAAMIAIVLSFCEKISAIISSIPDSVLGGMSILLYGVIACNGLRVLIDEQSDLSKQKNLIIVSAMLVIGLGGAMLPLGQSASLSSTALSAIVGVLLNKILPE